MAQVNEPVDLSGHLRILRSSNADVSVIQTGNTTLLELFTEGVEKIVVQAVASVQALDAFVIQTKAHPNADYVTRYSTSAHFTSPSGRILSASGDLTTLSAATGWFEMDVSGLFAVKILASGGNASPSTVSIYANGSTAGQGGSVPLAAGSALLGTVGIDQTTPGTTNAVTTRDSYSAVVSFTRTNDTNVYAANDVLGAATGSTAALTFASMGPNAGRVMLTGASLEIDAAAIISGQTSYVLHLYNVTPPSALGDNAPFDLPAGDRASYLGSINLGTPVDLGSTLYVSGELAKPIKLAGTSLFGYLVTVGTYTPAASTVDVVTLHALAM